MIWRPVAALWHLASRHAITGPDTAHNIIIWRPYILFTGIILGKGRLLSFKQNLFSAVIKYIGLT